MNVFDLDALERFDADKMAKVDLTASPHMICGLNCFAPGQTQKAHAHKGADKLYVVVKGSGEFSVGAERRTLSAGQALHVPEEIEHGVSNPSADQPLVVLIVIAPNVHG